MHLNLRVADVDRVNVKQLRVSESGDPNLGNLFLPNGPVLPNLVPSKIIIR